MFFIKPKYGKFIDKTDRVFIDGGRVKYTTITAAGQEMTHDVPQSEVSVSELKGISVKEWRESKESAPQKSPLKK